MMMVTLLLLLVIAMTTFPPSINGLVPPKTPVLTGFELAPVGSYRELFCDASQPDAGTITYKWYKYATDSRTGVEIWESNGPIGTSQKYVFNSVSVSGKYKCRATNSAGTRASEWGDLYVYKPCSRYTVSVLPAKPAIGSTFTLYCYIPNPTGFAVNWVKWTDASSAAPVIATANLKGCHAPDGIRYSWSTCSPPSLPPSSMTFNLQVTNAQPSDSAYWMCQDIGLSSCISNPIKPIVQAPPGTPQINGFPSGPVTKGTQLNLICVASSGDTYDWYKDGTKVTTSLSYDFQVTKESAGVYKCVVRNDVGSATSSEKTLVVYYKADSVVVSSGKTSSHVGENADKFTCTVTGGKPIPTLKIYFKRSGGTAVEVNQGQDKVMAKEDNQAEYYCEATVPGNSALKATSEIKTYNVTFAPNGIQLSETSITVKENVTKTITCSTTSSSNPAVSSVSVKKKLESTEVDVTGTSRVTNGAYYGKDVSIDIKLDTNRKYNGAKYICSFKYDSTAFEETATVNVQFKPSQITVLQESSTTVHTGQLITIICKTDSANPVANITFHRKRTGGTEEKLTSGITSEAWAGQYNGMIRKSTLTVTANRLDTQAVFKCEVKEGSFQVEQTTTVSVYYPPTVQIEMSSSPTPVKEGDTLALTCTANGGNPTTYTYKWFYKNKEIRNKTSKDYKIANIQYTQSGTYRCQAINYHPDGIADDSMNIDIQYKAKWNPELPEVFTVASKTNTPMKFVLHVIANPSPTTVTWFLLNKTAINNNITFTTAQVNVTTYTLSKASVQAQDYGNYTVNVTNAVGISKFIFELEKTGSPDPPCCLTLVNTTSVSLTLTFTSNFAGGTPQTFTIEKKTSGGNAWDIAVKGIADPGFETNVTQKIAGLDNDTMYEFRVKATNADGDSGYGNILEAKTEAAPNVKLTVIREDNQVTASWSKLSKEYTKIQIKFCPVKGGSCGFHDVADPTSLKSSFPVKEGDTFTYSMIIFDGVDQVFVSPAVSPPPSDQPDVAVIAGVVGGVLFFLIIIAVVLATVFILKKKRVEKEAKILNPSNRNGINGGEVNPGFTDLDDRHNSMNDGFNPYEDSVEMTTPSSSIQIDATVLGGAEYAVVEKGSKKPLIGDAYAEVDFKKKKGGKKGPPPPVGQAYAEVNFSKKSKGKKGKGKAPMPSAGPGGQAYADVDFTKKSKKGKASVPAAGPEGAVYAAVNKKEKAPDVIAVGGDVYAEVSKPRKPSPGKGESDDQAVYANVPNGDEEIYEDVRKDEPTETGYSQPKEAYQVGVDGTIYSQVRISLPKHPDVIRGIETIEEPYASVDFMRQAPPLPEPVDPDDPNDPGFVVLL